MRLFGSARINRRGHLEIGGCDTTDLAEEYGTPLWIMDENLIRSQCRLFQTEFAAGGVETEIIYAGKAFLTLGMCELIRQEGLALDVVSGGELYTALESGFPASQIYLHGNNKSRDLLSMAIGAGVGRIIVDNAPELNLVEEVCWALNRKAHVLLRVNPGIEAGAHDYIKTAKSDSKFGLGISSGEIMEVIARAQGSNSIIFKGLHCHIGSQIMQAEPFYNTAAILMDFIKRIDERGITSEELNLGGGFGVYYSKGDRPADLATILQTLPKIVREKARALGISCPKLMVEPGRALVANAGTTLYRAGGTKDTTAGRQYIFIDGGMNDNIRTALYGARYEAALANRMEDAPQTCFSVAGSCCEASDIVVEKVALPLPKPNDLVAVASTGAYTYSMASNYNRLPKPAVILVGDGRSRLLVRRETYEDIIRNDVLWPKISQTGSRERVL